MSENNPMPALYAALARAQAKFQPIVKNREVQITMKSGGKFKFRYADLEEIRAKTNPALTAEGLSIIQPVMSDPASGATWIETRLAHAEGGHIESRLDIKPAATFGDPKEFGAMVTYLRRYAVSALLGVAADDDLDQHGRGTGRDGDADGKFDKDFDVSALTDRLIAEVKKRDTDEAALAFWRTESKQLQAHPNAYNEFKDAAIAHRKSLATKQRQGATA